MLGSVTQTETSCKSSRPPRRVTCVDSALVRASVGRDRRPKGLRHVAQFLVLIYGDEQRWAAASEEWHDENGRRHHAFVEEAGAAVITGGGLAASTEAVCVRGDDLSGTIAAGPFVHADKRVGGFYLVEAHDLAQAVTVARRIPEASAPASGVEVRQLAVITDEGI